MFLFLWNFNPFSSNVLQDYMTKELRFSEQFYGHLGSVQSAAQIVACLAYFWYCRRVPLGWLVHWSIVAGILSTLTYWLVSDAWTAVLASIVFGLSYQTATLIQLDLSARICPTESAGTMFALLMALSNTGVTAGIYLGGGWYDGLTVWLGDRQSAFHALVGIGAALHRRLLAGGPRDALGRRRVEVAASLADSSPHAPREEMCPKSTIKSTSGWRDCMRGA